MQTVIYILAGIGLCTVLLVCCAIISAKFFPDDEEEFTEDY